MTQSLLATNKPGRPLVAVGLIFIGLTICWDVVAITAGAPRYVILFSLPFVLVGLGIAVWGGLQMMAASRVGTPEVTFSNQTPRVGERFSFNCRQTFSKQANIERILIQLLMRESATYRRGTNTYTVTHDQVIREFEHPGRGYNAGEMFFDEQTVQIPPDAMHTFEARRNKIIWLLTLKVEIAGWPDLTHEYPVTVLPERAQGEDNGWRNN
ncbi:MAG: hypothetical protein ACE5G8_13140 [Anaerolineae bacterium]